MFDGGSEITGYLIYFDNTTGVILDNPIGSTNS
jgi:hypothetical protein